MQGSSRPGWWSREVGVYQNYGYHSPIMENQMEKKMENEMETGNIWGIMGFRVYQNYGYLLGIPIRTIVY